MQNQYSINIILTDGNGERCSEVPSRDFGIIRAPDVDGDGYYDFNVHCIWFIEVAKNATVVFEIQNMSIEYSPTTGCNTDYLQVEVSLSDERIERFSKERISCT